MRKLLMPFLVLTIVCFASTVFAAPQAGALIATDLTEVDDDYAIQGEYVGKYAAEDESDAGKLGAQVIALGDGKFDVVFYPGGLPGAGWIQAEGLHQATAKRNDEGDVILSTPEDVAVGTISDGVIKAENDGNSVFLEKTERTSETIGLEAPEGATIIVGDDVNLTDGELREPGVLWAGANTTVQFEGPYTLHLEFLLPYMPQARGQGRANSGVYVHDCCEIQVLDSFGLEGLDNECGGIYRTKTPDVNMCLPPLVWQTYDMEYTPPVYDAAGEKIESALLIAKHNGVIIHENLEVTDTPGRQNEGPGPRGIHLQQHGNKVQYRNFWVLEK
jgi:hypothetical protein